MKLKYVTTSEHAKDLVKAHPDDAGYDLATVEYVYLEPGQHQVVSTGIKVELPPRTVGKVYVRSSVGIKKHVRLSNSVGIIDPGYTGEVFVSLHNVGDRPVRFDVGDRVAQLVIQPVVQVAPVKVSALSATQRGEGGIGSTGA